MRRVDLTTVASISINMKPHKTNIQYLLTLQVGQYYILALQNSLTKDMCTQQTRGIGSMLV